MIVQPSANTSFEVELDLEGSKPHPSGSAFFLSVEAVRVASGDSREPGRFLALGSRYHVVHAISRWAGGEVRGYVIDVRSKTAFVRAPVYPEQWPELDALVAKALGVVVDALTCLT